MIKKINDSTVDASALTIEGHFGRWINGLSFQQDAVLTHGDYQYVGYYNAARQVCLARRKLPTGDWQVIRFADYDFKSNDAHNTISIGICAADGTIHIAFDHHVHPLHYRMSNKGVASEPESVTWGAALFGAITDELDNDKLIRITYPRFIPTPDGGLQFCYRVGTSGNGDRWVVDYNPSTGQWENTRQIDSGKGLFKDEKGDSETRNTYPNGYDYDSSGKLHVTWVWRESPQWANHDLVYVYSEDRGQTWRNNAGQALDGPPHVNSPGVTVVNIIRGLGLMNTHGQAVDSKDRIHTVVWHCTQETLKAAGSEPWATRWGAAEARRYHHYWRDDDGKWQHRELPVAVGSRPKMCFDEHDNLYLIFLCRSSAEPMFNDVYFDHGDLVIMGSTAESRWADWDVIHTETGPFLSEALFDPVRWKQEQVVSVMMQESPTKPHDPTPLRILDFTLGSK